MIDELTLITGADIPFPEAELTIHQPTLSEISLIGEKTFLLGCEILRFSKEKISNKDKSELENFTDFDIIMAILNGRRGFHDPTFKSGALAAAQVLLIIFPDYDVSLSVDKIIFSKRNEEDEENSFQTSINIKNYLQFREILTEIFCLKKSDEKAFNPTGDFAKEIADKIAKGKEKIAKKKHLREDSSLFGRYLSILSVGTHQNFNDLKEYTIYQLYDMFNRYQLKLEYDMYVKAKMMGAKDLKDVDNWMKDLYEK